MKRAERLYVYLGIEPDTGNEAIAALRMPGHGAVPCVSSDRTAMEYLRPRLQTVADRHGTTFTLASFEKRTDLDTIMSRQVLD